MSNINVAGGTSLYIKQNGSDIQYSPDNSTWTTITTWPVGIINTNTSAGSVTIIFTTNISITSVNNYFVCGSSDLQFGTTTLNIDGTRPIIYIDNVTNYLGFIQNGYSGGNGYNNVSIYNLDIQSINSSTLIADGGWLTQQYFSNAATNNYICNCTSNGDIVSGGGLVGSYSGNNGASLTIRSCTSSGDMTSGAGGIVGTYCGCDSGTLVIDRCSSTGIINNNCGGIFGNSCGAYSINTIATNCYSSGLIIGGGGIYGITAAYSGTTNATNCYSTGSITSGSGGIYCGNAGQNSGTAIATNCYSSGNMTNTSGGIYGSGYVVAIANHCYTSGSKDITSGGIWTGSSSDSLQGSNNYSEANHSSSGWNDSNANSTLTGVSGATWLSLSTNTPYILSQSGYTPYSTSLINTVSSDLTAGDSTSAAIVPGYTYSIVSINSSLPSIYPSITINSSTGAISTTTSVTGGTYTIIVYSTKNPYSITTYTLTVSPYISDTDIPCCAIPLNLNNVEYTTRNQLITGNTLLGETNRRSPYPSYNFLYYMNMASASKRV